MLDIINNKVYNIDSKDRKVRSLTNEGFGRSEESRIVSGFLTPPGISGTGILAILPSIRRGACHECEKISGSVARCCYDGFDEWMCCPWASSRRWVCVR